MSNFFAALDDSGDEAEIKKTVTTKNAESKKKAPVAEPSKPNNRNRPRHDDRNTKSGRGRPPVRDGKRTHDRRSGTGRGREIKKGGGGGRNWGSDKNDAKKSLGPVDEETLAKQQNEGAATEETVEGATEEKTEQVPEKEPEPEDNTISYEEYLKIKERPSKEAFAEKAEKELTDEFAGIAMHKKEEEAFLVMGGGKNLRKKGNKKGEKERLVANFRVGEPQRRDRRDGDRDRRGGRGGRRGGRGDRGDRGGKKQQQKHQVNTNDTEAFPSL